MHICVVMPAWNEAEGIGEFLSELDVALRSYEPRFVVVDDCSTDGTPDAVKSIAATGIDVRVYVNETSRGHGPSTMRALQIGLQSDPSVIVAVDGDGQFRGADVRRVLDQMIEQRADIAEGVRISEAIPSIAKRSQGRHDFSCGPVQGHCLRMRIPLFGFTGLRLLSGC